MSLTELAPGLLHRSLASDHAVAITFDDGYATTLTACEILLAERIPFTVFVTTGAVGRDQTIWPGELALLLLHGQAGRLEVLGRPWPLSTRAAREATYRTIRRKLRALPADARRDAMDQIRRQFPLEETQKLLRVFPSFAMMTWDEISQIATAGVDIGSHGVHHESHHERQLKVVRETELTESKAELERRLARACTSFAFPSGDTNPLSASEVRAAGYALGLTIERGRVTPGTNPYLLPRLKAAQSARAFVRDCLGGRGPGRGAGLVRRLKSLRAGASAVVRVVRDVRRGLSFAGAVLDRPLTVESALETVRARMVNRASGFLATLDQTIFSVPRSPYRPLLEAAGYDRDQIRSLVSERGVEGALERLRDEGVYISIEEFKGLGEVRRKDRVFRFTDQDFSNPLISSGLAVSSGGTRTVSITSVISSTNLRTGAEHLALALAAYGLESHPMIVWLPQSHGASHWAVLAVTMMGRSPIHWFSQLPDRRLLNSARVNREAIRCWGYMHGKRIPSPRYMPFGQESAILRAVDDAGTLGCGILTTPSSALRLALEAKRVGTRLENVTFITIGEPLSPAKLSAIHGVGARAFSSLGFTEFGRASYGCPLAGHSDDTHLCRDAVAVIQRQRPVDRFGAEVQALLFTSLLPDARRVLLNVETGDYAVATARRCGCLLDSAGWTDHLEGIRSFEKLNAEGRRFFGSQIISLVEETLPARFGGGPTDYQMVEEEDQDGFTRLYIIADPRLGALDERDVLACVEKALQTHHPIGTTVWKEAGTIRLRRANPILTQAGKLMPLHHLGLAPRLPSNEGTNE